MENLRVVNFFPGHPLSYTTTKIDLFYDATYLGSGTGFVMSYGQEYALVTNWHVISGINPTDGKCLHRLGGVPNRIEFHVTISVKTSANGTVQETLDFRKMNLPLYIDGEPIWVDEKEPSNQNDYAIIILKPFIPDLTNKNTALRAVRGGTVTLRRGIDPTTAMGIVNIAQVDNLYPSVGGEVFVLGYPHGMQATGIFPIWKRASIASEPQCSVNIDGIEYIDVFYIDGFTKQGMSGSPVIYLSKNGDKLYGDSGTVTDASHGEPILVGVYSGRNGVTKDEYELSLGRVWKIGAVDRLIWKGLKLSTESAQFVRDNTK